jgi:hypothetical protein
MACGVFNAAGSFLNRKASNRAVGDHDEHATGLNQITDRAMNRDGSMDKIDLIRSSLRCFACGIIGLLPFIGIPFAVAAIWDFRRVFFGKSTLWNAAQPYLSIGAACATFGLLLDLLIVTAIIIQIS